MQNMIRKSAAKLKGILSFEGASVGRKFIACLLALSLVGTNFLGVTGYAAISSGSTPSSSFTVQPLGTGIYLEEVKGLPNSETALILNDYSTKHRYLRVYDAFGAKKTLTDIDITSAAQTIAADPAYEEYHLFPMNNGNILVEYNQTSTMSGDFVGKNAFFMVFSNTGALIVPETQINVYSGGSSLTREVSIAELSSGDIVFSYQRNDNQSIATRIYSESGSLGAEQLVVSYDGTKSVSSVSHVAANPNGTYLIQYGYNVNPNDYHYKTYSNSGNPIVEGILPSGTGNDWITSLNTLSNGNYLLVMGYAGAYILNSSGTVISGAPVPLPSGEVNILKTPGQEGFIVTKYSSDFTDAYNNGLDYSGGVPIGIEYYDNSCTKQFSIDNADSGRALLQGWDSENWMYATEVQPSFSVFPGYSQGLGIVKTDYSNPGDNAQYEIDCKLFDMETAPVGPTISSVSVPTANVYRAGVSLSFTVNFDQNITVSGTNSTLGLTIGLQSRAATYASNTANSITYSYTVAPGDNDSDGITVGALSLNGNTIQDESGHAANLTLNNVEDTSNVRIDSTAPTVTSVEVPSSGTYREGGVLEFTVRFSEPITVTGTPTMALDVGGRTVQMQCHTPGSGESSLVFSCSVASGDNDSDGVAVGALSLNGGSIQDSAGNNADVTLHNVGSTSGVLVDTTVPGSPTIQLAASSDTGESDSDGITNNTTPVFWGTAEPGSTVVLYDTDGYTMLGTATAPGGHFAISSSALSEGTHTLTVKAADSAGNISAASSGIAITIDTTPPGVLSIGLSAGSDSGVTGDGITHYTAPTFVGTTEPSAKVTLLDANGTLGTLGTAIADAGGNYSFTPGSPFSPGYCPIVVNATDKAGNFSELSLPFSLVIRLTPTLTTTPSAPAYMEGGAAVSLFSGTSADTGASAFTSLTLTVSNVTDGSGEMLKIDGTNVALTDGNSVTTGSGYSCTVSLPSGTATVTVSKAGINPDDLSALVDGIQYRNASEDPAGTPRAVTLTSVTDTLFQTATPIFQSHVTVVAVNDAPTVSATDVGGTYDGSTIPLFRDTAVSTVEAGQKVRQIKLTVSGVKDGSNEILEADGSDILLTDGTGVTSGNEFVDTVSVTGNDATVTLIHPGDFTPAEAQALVDSLKYRNSAGTPSGGNRVVTLTEIQDNGGTAKGGADTASLSISSEVTVPIPVADGLTVDVAAKSPAEEGKVNVTISPAAQPGNTIYYRVADSDPDAPNVGDPITESEWTENTNGTAAFEVSAADGQYVEAVEMDAGGNVVKWGKSDATDDGFVSSDSSIGTAATAFDKNTANQLDITVIMTLNGNTLVGIQNGSADLAEGTDYTISGSTVKIKKSYLAGLEEGTVTLTFHFSAGADCTLTVIVVDTTSSAPGLITSFDPLSPSVATRSVPYGTLLKNLNLPGLLKAVVDGVSDSWVKVANWASNIAYNPTKPGAYEFTPVLDSGYVVDSGVELPQINVTVGKKPHSGSTSTPSTQPEQTPKTETKVDTSTNTATVMTRPISITGSGSTAVMEVTVSTVTVDNTATSTNGNTVSQSQKAAVEIQLPAQDMIQQLNAKKDVDLTVAVPSGVVAGSNSGMTFNVKAAKEIFEAAKTAQTDVTIKIKDANTQQLAYSWTFKGEDLAKSAVPVTDVNIAMGVHLTTEVPEVNAVTLNSTGIVLSFDHSGPLPSVASVRIPVVQKGFQPGQKLYFYYYNPSTQQIETLGTDEYTVDSEGYVTVQISHCSDYVLLPNAARSLNLDTKSYVMAPGGRYIIGVKQNAGNGNTVKVYSSTPGMVTVTKLKNGNYQVDATKPGLTYIMFDVYDEKGNRILKSHASAQITVRKGAKPSGDSHRQTALF